MDSIKNASLNNSSAENYVQLTIKHCQEMDKQTAPAAGVQFVKTIFLSYDKDDARKQHCEL